MPVTVNMFKKAPEPSSASSVVLGCQSAFFKDY